MKMYAVRYNRNGQEIERKEIGNARFVYDENKINYRKYRELINSGKKVFGGIPFDIVDETGRKAVRPVCDYPSYVSFE